VALSLLLLLLLWLDVDNLTLLFQLWLFGLLSDAIGKYSVFNDCYEHQAGLFIQPLPSWNSERVSCERRHVRIDDRYSCVVSSVLGLLFFV